MAKRTKVEAPVTAAAPASVPGDDFPRITKAATKEYRDGLKMSLRLVGEADPEKVGKPGVYRVIHSNVWLPRPLSEWMNPDGTRKPNEESLAKASIGDEIYLGAADAYSLLKKDIVEDLDAKPSRAGKVFSPPASIPNVNVPSHVRRIG